MVEKNSRFEFEMLHNQQVNPALRQLVVNTENWAAGMYAFKIVIPHSPIEINGKFDVVH
jgi:hypothetical protein